MGFLDNSSRLCSALILVAVNCVFLAGGIVVVYSAHHAKNSGWVDVIESYWDSTDTILNAVEITGYVIIALAVLGSVATCLRSRVGLLIYAIIVCVLMLAFAAIAAVAFTAQNTAKDWNSKTYPADDSETTVKTNFDSAYCLAQGAYICNEMTVDDAAAVFYPDFAGSSLLSGFSSLKGVNAMCDAFLNLVPSLSTVCKGCAAAKEFENFTAVLDWANDECPRTNSTLLWCGTYLGSGNESSITIGTAPYTECRSEFLSLVSDTALTLGTGSILVSVGALFIIIFTCCVRRKERMEERYGNMQSQGQLYGTPQSQQPFVGTPTSHSKV